MNTEPTKPTLQDETQGDGSTAQPEAQQGSVPAPTNASVADMTKLSSEVRTAEQSRNALVKLRDEKRAELKKLEIEVDLADERALSRIGRLQTICAIVPQRVVMAEGALISKQRELCAVIDVVISRHIGPKLRALATTVHSKLSADYPMATFPNRGAVNLAIDKSTPMHQVKLLQHQATIRPFPAEQAVSRAQELLAVWRQAEELEKSLK